MDPSPSSVAASSGGSSWARGNVRLFVDDDARSAVADSVRGPWTELENAIEGRYVWLPVLFRNGRVELEWRDEWRFGR